MLNVTTEAGKYLHMMMADADLAEGQTLRLIQRDENLGFAIDQVRSQDRQYTHDGTTILVVAPDIGPVVDQKTLDLRSAESGPKLVLE